MLKLTFQYFGHLIWRAASLKKTQCWERLKTKGEAGGRGWDGWMASPTQGHEFEQTLGGSEGQGGLACCSPWGHKQSDTTERLNWTELLYNIVVVLPYIDMNLPRVYMCSASWTPFPPHSPYHPSASSQCTSPEHPVSSNLDWRFVSHVIIYMFQCHSPISSHPRPLPQSPKDCSIHLCLFCCLAYRVIITIFLNFIYMY